MTGRVFDLPALDEEEFGYFKEDMGDEAQSWLIEFMAGLSGYHQQMEARCDQDDAQGLREVAHSLKGLCRLVGGAALADICQTLETMGREGRLVGAPALIEAAGSEIGRLKGALNERLGSLP